MCGMVKEYLKKYDVCQRLKNDCMKSTGLLQPLPFYIKIWISISMDFIEGLSSSNGYFVIMVVVDHLTKYAYFAALKHLLTTEIIAKAFVTNMVRWHRILMSMVSDHDRVFLNSFW